MRETYGNKLRVADVEIPPDIGTHRYLSVSAPALRSTLVWAEHCTECAMPACYTTCNYYTPRHDLHCRRFYSNIEKAKTTDSGEPWLTVRFRKWAKLQAEGVPSLFNSRRRASLEVLDRWIGVIIRTIPMRHGFRMRLANYWTRKKARIFHSIRSAPINSATHFVIESYNPQSDSVGIVLTIRRKDIPAKHLQCGLELLPGYNLDAVDVASFLSGTPGDAEFWISVELDGDTSGPALCFGHLDFVLQADQHVDKPPVNESKETKAKCVVWDLDNTIWEGVLIEQGVEGVHLRGEIVDVIRELDRRGILNSIASKNDPQETHKALKHFAIDQYFVVPQIGWEPKSAAIDRIRRGLNIGIDTFIFVDDQPFERAEVAAVHGEITIFDENEAIQIPHHRLCDVVVTEESRRRRHFYQQQIERETAQTDFRGDYVEFLKSCQIVLQVEALSIAKLDRVHELAQRTNQMNFSGNRYSRAQLRELAVDPNKETYVIHCQDRFGDYGIVGFGVIDRRTWCLEDLMFSCRVQAKRIEHHFIAHIAHVAADAGATALRARYVKSDRNAVAGRVFEELGFAVVKRTNKVHELELKLGDVHFEHCEIEIREFGGGVHVG